jgi:RNA polymerase sigma factor (sigma-70 family)
MTVKEYNTCVDLYSDRVYRFIIKNLKDEDMAQDIIQDTYLKLWEKHENVDFSKAKSYIFTAAYHTMIDYIRKNKRMVSYESNESSDFMDSLGKFTPAREHVDLKKILHDALALLSDDQRSVILLRDYEGYSYQEIGQITGLSEAQVKVYIYRARLFLKNYIKDPSLVM